MKITKSIIINKPANDVWKIVAHDFDLAHMWMGPVPHSYDLGKGCSDIGAPMEGRICQLSKNPDGAKAKEVITEYSEEDKTLTFDITPINVPEIVPVKRNRIKMSVVEKGPNKTEVVWIASPQLKFFAYPFYPLLRFALPMAFGKLLKGLKTFAEAPSAAKAV